VNTHLTDEQLVGYVHYTLTDAGRETMDRHLRICASCRARLDGFESLQRRIRYQLAADIRATAPSTAMRFSAIAPRLTHRNRRDRLQTQAARILPSVAVLSAGAGLAATIAGLFYALGRRAAVTDSPPDVSFPMLACICFAATIMGGHRVRNWSPRRVLLKILAFVLWLGTAIVGLQVIVTLLDLLTWMLHMNVSSSSAVLASWALIPLGVGWIALVVGGGEYHYRHWGQRESWVLFAFTVALQALILCIPLLAHWVNLPPVWR